MAIEAPQVSHEYSAGRRAQNGRVAQWQPVWFMVGVCSWALIRVAGPKHQGALVWLRRWGLMYEARAF